MNFVTTNIRIPEDDYLRLKAEAAKRRKSLSAVIREKIRGEEESRPRKDVKRMMDDLDQLADKNAKYFKGIDGVTIIREMRYKDS